MSLKFNAILILNYFKLLSECECQTYKKKLFDHGKYKQIHNLAVSLTFSDPDQ